MAYLGLFLALMCFGGIGWWRGGIRTGLGILPLLLASVLLWLLAGPVYGWTVRSHMQLLWPGLFIILLGLSLGYVVAMVVRRKLKDRPVSTGDRIAGATIGLFIGIVLTWVGSLYFAVKAAAEHRQAGSSGEVANLLNASVVRWIPGVGAGSDALMDLREIAAADEESRRVAVENLKLDKLPEVPAVRAVIEDEQTIADIQSLGEGELTAILRLQKNELIIELFDSPEVREVLDRVSLKALAAAVREAQEKGAKAGG